MDNAVGHVLGPYQKLFLSVGYFLNVCVFSIFFIVLQNLGWWNIALYVWPEDLYLVRDIFYCVLGVVAQALVEKYIDTKNSNELARLAWENGLPQGFDWKRKISFYIIYQFEQMAFLIFWVGMWEVLDARIWEITMQRDMLYFFVAIPPLFICQECLSRESLCWIAAHLQLYRKKVEREKDTVKMPLEPSMKIKT